MDILSLLPANTVISGSIGDDDLYVSFDTTLATAREDIAATCAIHAEQNAEFFANGITPHATTPASYWIYEQFEAVMPDLPDVILKLATANGDVRSDWRVVGFEYRGHGDVVHNWDNDPKEWKAKAEYLRKLADFLDKLAGM